MLIIGLTGSISTGKSTVSTILSSPPHNLPIIDADLLARQVVEPGTKGHAAITAHFGPSTPDLLLADGSLNRVVLGKRVFGTDAARQQDRRVLNGIVHPLVQREIFKAITKNYLQGHWACVLDIPLLFESSLDILCGTVLVVAVSSRDVQLARLLARDTFLTRQDAEHRVLSQMLIEEKMQRAERIYGVRGRGHVLLNDGSVDELRDRVGDMLEGIRSGRDGWWKWTLLVVPPLAGAVAGGVVVMNWWWRRRWVRERERERARL
ncbi:Dephospho-CoA kinase cab5 [Maublancomyces gigas]|uniref:Dephospho-CoA kinase cab5 n=1 Tax=Discina gigas TaxID=1032678 RepID=A0ABR3GVW4_9PEZI